MKRVKVCGLTRYEDARLASELGAWALGFIFYQKSPRYVDLKTVIKINDQFHGAQVQNAVPALRIGVFVDPEIEQVLSSVKLASLDGVQLHGHETGAFCTDLKRQLEQPVKVFKAIRPRNEADIAEVLQYSACDALLVDTFSKDKLGGSGMLSNWTLAKQLSPLPKPVILSGGLKVDNAIDALETVKPFALDLSSGLEESPGVKSADKMKQFFTVIRSLK